MPVYSSTWFFDPKLSCFPPFTIPSVCRPPSLPSFLPLPPFGRLVVFSSYQLVDPCPSLGSCSLFPSALVSTSLTVHHTRRSKNRLAIDILCITELRSSLYTLSLTCSEVSARMPGSFQRSGGAELINIIVCRSHLPVFISILLKVQVSVVMTIMRANAGADSEGRCPCNLSASYIVIRPHVCDPIDILWRFTRT